MLKGHFLIPHSCIIVFINNLNIVLFHCIIMIFYGIWPYYQWSAYWIKLVWWLRAPWSPSICSAVKQISTRLNLWRLFKLKQWYYFIIKLHAFKNCSTCSSLISFYAFHRFFLLLLYCRYFNLVLARETKIMYSIFLFNFIFKCNYWSPVFDILMYTFLLTIAYLYDYCIYMYVYKA